MNVPCKNTLTGKCIGDGVGELQYDSYGYATGHYCYKCYEEGYYPYRKDAYFDPSYAGERLEDNY